MKADKVAENYNFMMFLAQVCLTAASSTQNTENLEYYKKCQQLHIFQTISVTQAFGQMF
jgi:hypothetical protein